MLLRHLPFGFVLTVAALVCVFLLFFFLRRCCSRGGHPHGVEALFSHTPKRKGSSRETNPEKEREKKMTTVSTEEKWSSVVMTQYAYITTKEYIKLGCSLGAVQACSFMRRLKLLLMETWQSVLMYTSWSWWRGENRSDTNDSQNSVEEHLQQILVEIAVIAKISHGQSISTKVLSAFSDQATLVSTAPPEHQVAFEMATTDVSLEDMRRRGAPLCVTYGEAIALTNLLSEALAWEWYWLTSATPTSTINAVHARKDVDLKTRSHTLALMLNNSPEFNLIWIAASEASIWMTFLDALYSTETFGSNDVKHTVTYHHCSTALLNTNIPNNRMLCHSLECAASELLVMEEDFLPLLFEDENENQKGGGRNNRKKRVVKLPECVRRVFVWRSTQANMLVPGAEVRPWMLMGVQRFNEARGNSDTHDTILDLAGLISHRYQLSRQKQYLCMFQILKERILCFPPNVLELPFEQQWHATSVRSLTREALLLFSPVMPVLHIYTSGTTGLPKAARFSHLRFFATFFLSSVLPMRRKAQKILVKKWRGNKPKEAGKYSFFKKLKNILFLHQPSFAEELNVLTVYNCLPMYHTVGCVFCMAHLLRALEEQQNSANSGWWRLWGKAGTETSEGTCRMTKSNLQNGLLLTPTARMIIRSKFSSSRFASDLQYYRVTVVQYIGEILRYALQYERQKKREDSVVRAGDDSCVPIHFSDDDDNNCEQKKDGKLGEWVVPFAFGNGLRSDIWCECKETLCVSQIVEFYSSTEGNVFLINLFDIPGVIGHLPLFPFPLYRLSTQFNPLFPFRVVRYDFERDEVWRHPSSGRCAHCRVGEIGEVIGEIIHGYDMFGLRRFDGYHSNVETQKNIIRGVFKKNDAYFLSGDLVKFDAMGFATFVDRVGETFRWKGENVSTTEVMNALSGVSGQTVAVQEAVVYGVQVAGREGRTGMAKLSLTRVVGGHRHSLDGTTFLPPTLEEERLFLQNEFYALLSGKGCGQVLLAGYAIPMCIRIDDDPAGGHEQQRSESRELPDEEKPFRPATARDAGGDNGAHTTTTFKYRRHVLVQDGFQYALSSSEASSSRVYVLVVNRGLLAAVGIPPIPYFVACGYVPLNSKTAGLLGEELQNCGW